MKIVRKYQSNTSFLLLILVSMSLLSCSGLNTPLGMTGETKTDSDEEAEAFDRYMDQEIRNDKNRITSAKAGIRAAETEKNSLGDKNKHLKKVKKSKEQAVNVILRELREDVANDRELELQGSERCTISLDCKKCGKHVEFNFCKLEELVQRYRDSYTLRDKYAWYILHEWNCHVKQNEVGHGESVIPACPECMDEESVTALEKTIKENADDLAQLEAKMVLERLKLGNAEHELAKDENIKKVVAQVSNRRQHYRAEAAASMEMAAKAREDLEKKQELEREEIKSLGLELAKDLLEAGAPRGEIMEITGLTEEELNEISVSASSGSQVIGDMEKLAKEELSKMSHLESQTTADISKIAGEELDAELSKGNVRGAAEEVKEKASDEISSIKP